MEKPHLYQRFESSLLSLSLGIGRLLHHRYGLWVLGAISFIESALLVPIITDPFMVAYILAHRTRALSAVVMTTASSLFGGFTAYVTATFFMNLVLDQLSPDATKQFYDLQNQFMDGTFLLGFIGALTPIPFTLTALVAGTLKSNLLVFLLGSLFGRVIRYGVVGYISYEFGQIALTLGKRYLGIITILTFFLSLIYLWLIM